MSIPNATPPSTAKRYRRSQIVLIIIDCGCGYLVSLFFSGIISAIVFPNLADALEKAKQNGHRHRGCRSRLIALHAENVVTGTGAAQLSKEFSL